jgi:TolB-like protein/Tfp pilus assembly protein PilF
MEQAVNNKPAEQQNKRGILPSCISDYPELTRARAAGLWTPPEKNIDMYVVDCEHGSAVRLRFGPFEVDTTDARLWKHGIAIPLREQVFQVLVALLEHPGEVVTRDELRRRIWEDSTTVDFDAGLNTAISRLRAALNDNPESVRFIETVPKRGYRFVAPVPKQSAIAVMPFAVQGADPEGGLELFADGLTEDLIASASQIEGLRVAGRSVVRRFEGKQCVSREVARELGVNLILEGTLRRAGGGVRVTVHLIGADGFEVWSERFEGDWPDILAVQDRIAEGVAAALQLRIASGSPGARSVNPAAYMAYRRGHYLVARHGLSRALEYFHEASHLDPQYALPYQGAAVAHILTALVGAAPAEIEMRSAEHSLERALDLAPEASYVQHTLGMLRMFQCRWAESDHAYERAVALDPGNVYGHMMYALEHSFRGRHEQALERARRALELEPVDAMTNFRMTQCLYYARRYGEAIEWGQRTAELAPGFASAHIYLAWAHVELGANQEAWAMAQKAREFGEDNPLFDGVLGQIAARLGRHSDAERALIRICQRGAAIPIAWIHIGVGEHDRGIDALETAFLKGEPYVASMAVFPGYDVLRSHPRFRALLARVEKGALNNPEVIHVSV